MCSWNIDAPDTSATTSNLNHLMHIIITPYRYFEVYKRKLFAFHAKLSHLF